MENPKLEHHPDHPGIPEEIREPGAPKEKIHQLREDGYNYVRENPTVVAFGILVIGIIIGFACGERRSPKRKDSTAAAKDFADDFLSKISNRWPPLKKQKCCSSSILEHCQDAGRKLKWW